MMIIVIVIIMILMIMIMIIVIVVAQELGGKLEDITLEQLGSCKTVTITKDPEGSRTGLGPPFWFGLFYLVWLTFDILSIVYNFMLH